MLRLVYLVIRFLFEIPFLIFQIKRYKKHPERYSLEERINWTRKLLRKATRRARNTTTTAAERSCDTLSVVSPI